MEPAVDGQRSTLRLEIEVRTLLLLLGVVLAALLLASLLSAASRPLGWGLACALVAALLAPLITRLDRHVPHALAVIVIIAGLALTLVAAWVGIASTIVDSVDRIVDEAPAAAAEIEERHTIAQDFGLTERVTNFAEGIEERFGLGAQLERSPSTASTYIVTGILMLFLVVYGPRLASSAIAQIPGDRRRSHVEEVAAAAYSRWVAYIWAAAAQAVALTLVAWPVFWWLDLPGPFVLALLVGMLSAIPYVGIPTAGIGVLLFAAATTDATTIGVVAAFLVVVSSLEIIVVRRRVDSATLYVGPAVPIVVALLGWELYGFGGALFGTITAIFGLSVLHAIDSSHRLHEADAAPASDAPA
jgi:predicted PurR-regulated permease PerM